MSMQALVIDDEAQIRRFVSQVLTEESWEVSEADSAERAFEMVRDRDWSVVFCDVRLGGADGFSVLRRFKEELPQAKVVLMTGHGTAVGALDAKAVRSRGIKIAVTGCGRNSDQSTTSPINTESGHDFALRHEGSPYWQE